METTEKTSPAQTPPPATAPTPPPATEPATATDKIDTFLAAVDQARDTPGSGATVEINRVVGAGRVPLARISADDFDPCTLPTRYGPGKYFCRLRIGTKWNGSATFDYSQATTPAPGVGAALAPTPAPTPAGGGDFSAQGLLGALLATQQQTMQNMTAILTAVLTRDTGPKISELAALMNTGKRSEVGEIVAAIRELSDMHPGGSPANDDREPDDLGTIAKLLGPMMAAQAAAPAAPTPRAPTMIPREVAARLRRRHDALQRIASPPPPPPPPPPAPPQTPAQPQPQPEPASSQMARLICHTVRQCYSASLGMHASAAALIATIDETPAGGPILDAAAELSEIELADLLGKDAAEFRTGERRSWAEGLAAAVLDQLNADADIEDDDSEDYDDDDAGNAITAAANVPNPA